MILSCVFVFFFSFHALLPFSQGKISQKYFYKVGLGYKLFHSEVVASCTVNCELECSNQCLTVRGCIAFNYIASADGGENCQLTNKTRDKTMSEKETGGQWMFYEIVETTRSENIQVAEKSCTDLYKSGARKDGVYSVDPDGQGLFQVRCEMTSGGWTVIQRRMDGSVDFFLDWSQYKNGFGDLHGEFWIGLDKIHRLTRAGLRVLRVDLVDFNDVTAYAEYDTFEISDELHQYTLKVAGFSGNAGDSLAYHNGQKFSTKDKDHTSSCAKKRKGAWWYLSCAWSNLNGEYLGSPTHAWHAIQWYYWKNSNECMKKTTMKLRE